MIAERTEELAAFCAEHFAAQRDRLPPRNAPSTLDDDKIVQRAREAGNGGKFMRLWSGDTSGHDGDDSAADLALCSLLAFWTQDVDQLDRLFRRSGLYREKWDRADYRVRTINRALSRTEVYEPAVAPITTGRNGKSPHADGPLDAHELAADGPHQSDLGNAKRLVSRHGEDLRHCRIRGAWFAWDGRRWALDESGEVERRAKETVLALYGEAATLPDRERTELVKHALRSEAHARIAAMIALAETEPGIPVTMEQLDRDPMLLNVRNGTLDLRTGELRPHDRSDLLTRLVPIDYDPLAWCPTWEAFLGRAMAGNTDTIDFLQRAAGYSLTGSTMERCLFILHGGGKNGKSTFIEALAGVLADYASRTATDTLLASRDAGIPNDVARLKGARFVFASEGEEGRRLAEAKIKELTGGDTITARFMRGEWFDFLPEFKLWLSTNHKPTIRGTDEAIWDRIRLIPFAVRIPEAEQDKGLKAKLLAEAPGILTWAVEGCLAWQRDGLGESPDVLAATQGYRAEMDVIGQFIADQCVIEESAQVTAKALYAAYANWADDAGEKAISQQMFGRRLTERGFDSVQLGKYRVRTWIGIGLFVESGGEQILGGERI